MNLPARGYTWEPFEPGNVAHLAHGAWSNRLVAARAVELVEMGALASFEQLQDGPCGWMQEGDRWAHLAWIRAEARCEMLTSWLDRVGIEDGKGGIRESVIGLLLRAEREGAQCRERLGLDPRSRMMMARDTSSAAFSHAATSRIEALQANGRATRASREMAEMTNNPSLPATTAETATETAMPVDSENGGGEDGN